MERARAGERRLHPAWWTLIMLVTIGGLVLMSSALFAGTFIPSVPVTLAADRSGLVMESGAKVKMRGIQVGRVSHIQSGTDHVSLRLDLFPDEVKFIPANVSARIRATTAFGAKYVDLIYPEHPDAQRISAGQTLYSQNVSTEVNTIFQNLVGLLDKVDTSKLNAVLTAVADGVRGKGPRIGEATSAANEVLIALNQRQDTIRADWRAFKGFSDTYAAAAPDILAVLDAASTTAKTISANASALDALLLSVTGFSNSGIQLLAPNQDNLVQAINTAEPTTDLLYKYNPEIACTILGAVFYHDHGAQALGGNGRSVQLDSALLFGDDLYKYPENLPIVAAKGGPGGKPGCGSLPIVDNNWPQRYLVTNTGWGTGLDLRPNPGIGHPFWIDYFPATRAVPEPPSVRLNGPPAPGPIVPPGSPPYGAPWYGPDGTPLFPNVPPPPPAPAPPPPGG
ncbi:MCE family protein [Mycobacterium sp. CVI_P3]|uniref:MCE family protein n=1 Tax=Mycobacterium pinniadriaticum TaxID=2994102 RepID=A0ABT3SC42_9MYCO|nr:MCE family protein [Mycobacterium pinniadriaticum]MCX2929894.1 MCE family protein [Mycobacterium pinniadriaticum]MCX2936457.1 MCE family protein [Mycobacterium pinniadriaticum]